VSSTVDIGNLVMPAWLPPYPADEGQTSTYLGKAAMRTKRRIASAILATTIAVLVSGTAQTPSSAAGSMASLPHHNRGFIIRIPGGQPHTDVARVFRRGAVFSAALDENASTGYTWVRRATAQAGPILTFLDTDMVRDPSTPNMAGVGGTRYFRYRAEHHGVATISLNYMRTWEGTPVAQVVIHVQVV
jgi:predicted secreted protein